MSIILGCDPGSIRTGWALIESHPLSYISSGVIQLGDGDFWERIGILKQHLSQILSQAKPNVLVLEKVFVGINKQSALKLSQIRGALMISCFDHSMEYAEYAAREVKQQITGYGAAEKEQVAHMVKQCLQLDRNIIFSADESDALAIAVCHSYQANLLQKIKDAPQVRQAYKGIRR